MHFRRIAVIYNPNSGRPRERIASVNRFTAMLRDAGREVLVLETEYPGHATDLARQAVAAGCDLVVAHGGDGTMNEVLQAVACTDVTLGFWPGGTANVLAAEINFPARIPDVVARILVGNVRKVTVGKANQRYFLLMAGVGLDAAVAGSVDPVLKKRLGKGAFGAAALKYLWNWDPMPFRVRIGEGEGEEYVGRFVVAGNARSYGGGFQLTPRADLGDPDLDLCIFTSYQRVDYFWYAVAAIFGWHREMPGVEYRKVRRARLTEAARKAVPIQVDGELAGTLPVLLESVPEGLNLLV